MTTPKSPSASLLEEEISNAPPPGRTIVLVGLMGAGKTTVGRRLAMAYGMPFFDADHEIETAADMVISEYFDKYGEAAFRSGEERVIERILNGPDCVLATGGGAFMSELTRSRIQEQAISVWLQADIDVLVKRTSMRDTRPLLKGKNAREVLRELDERRSPVYATADITVTSLDMPHKMTVDQIIASIKKFERITQQEART